MTTEQGIVLILALGLFWIAILIRRANEREQARAAIRRAKAMRMRGSWLASWALQDAYNACYDAGLIEEYMDLHEWFYGRKG